MSWNQSSSYPYSELDVLTITNQGHIRNLQHSSCFLDSLNVVLSQHHTNILRGHNSLSGGAVTLGSDKTLNRVLIISNDNRTILEL